MQCYAQMRPEQLSEAYDREMAHYEACKARGLDLNMA